MCLGAVHLGIDVGADALFVVKVDEGKGTCTSLGHVAPSALAGLIDAHKPMSVAIDAPNGLSSPSGAGRRHCEVLLGIGGCYATSSDRASLPAWMETGLAAHETAAQLLDGGPPRTGGDGRVFEVHPTYGFRSLLGVEVSAQRCVADPAPRLLVTKKREEGRAQRRALVAALATMLGLEATGFLLVLAMRGQPAFVLHVIDIRAGGDDVGRARWSGDGAPAFWVVADDGWRPSAALDELIQTWTSRGWVNGLGGSPGQGSWRCMRLR